MRLPLLAILCGLLVVPPAYAGRCGDDVDGRAVPCDCGDVLVASHTLTDDDPITQRTCPGPGLLVDVPETIPTATLSLGGRTVQGSGWGTGMQVLSGGATGLRLDGPGFIRGFHVGIVSTGGALARATAVSAIENRGDGFEIAGSGFVVTECEATRNGRDGFALHGHGYRADGNRALQNGRVGFALAGRDAAVGGTTGNEAAGNGSDGVRVRGRDHALEGTVTTANKGHGIRAHVAGGRIADAVASSNRRRGIDALGPGLTVRSSAAHGNGGGLVARGLGVRDGGGNRADDCRIGGPCR